MGKKTALVGKSSNPSGFGAESKTSAQQPYNLESCKGFCDAFGFGKINRKLVEDYVEQGKRC